MVDNAGRPSRRALVLGGAGALTLAGGASVAGGQAQAATSATAASLTAALNAYAATRSGTYGLMVYDRRTRRTFTWRPFTNQSMSTIKVLILVALIRRSAELGRTLTSSQRSLAAAMITRSDNAATNTLLGQIGTSTVRRVQARIGMPGTTFLGGTSEGSSSWWGYSTTTLPDLIRLMDTVVWDPYVISAKESAWVRTLMAQIVSSQRWGVCDPPLPLSVATENKNGWGYMSSGYRADERHRLRVMAVLATRGRDVASHASALALHRLPVWGVPTDVIDVEADVARSRICSGLRPHPRSDAEPAVADGYRCVPMTTAVVQVALRDGLLPALVALDHALHHGRTTLDTVATEAQRHRSRSSHSWHKDARRLDDLLALADPGASRSARRAPGCCSSTSG